jgi:hypothetical protein
MPPVILLGLVQRELKRQPVSDSVVITLLSHRRASLFSKIKKNAKPRVKIVTLKTRESGKADIAYLKNTPHVPLRQIAEAFAFFSTT